MRFLQSISKLTLILAVAAWLSACGGGSGGGDDDGVDPVVLDFVLALFTTNGADWNDYLSGSDFASATDTACDLSGDPNVACVHGGELRTVEVSGRSSCAGLTATDDLGAFIWICDDSANPVRMVSTGLAEGRYLSDMVDFTAIAFRENAVTVFLNGAVYGNTPSSVWWANPVRTLVSDQISDITLVTSDPKTALSFQSEKSALVIQPGLSITGPGLGAIVIDNFSRKFIWLEGSIDASGDTTGVQSLTTDYSVLRNVSVKNALVTGIGLQRFRNSRLEDIRVSNNQVGLSMLFSTLGSDNNSITNVVASNNGSFGIAITDGDNNTLTGLTLSNNGTGIIIDGVNNSRFAGVSAHNNGGVGIRTFASNRNNVFTGVSTVNNDVGFLFHTNLTADNTVSNLAAANNNVGIQLFGGSERSLLADITASNNTTGIILDASNDNTFTGTLQVGNNLTSNCSVIGGTSPGLWNTTCAINGSSDHTLTTDISLANSFVGKVTAEDLQNTSDTNGAVAGFPGDPALFDWAEFDNRYRGWGIDGSAFPNADHRRNWITTVTPVAGRIWDWSVSTGDTGNDGNPALLDVVVLPTGIDTLTHNWFGVPVPNDNAGCNALVVGSLWNGAECETEFLRNAVEIPSDSIGNDNNLCETGETCLFMPNIGSYQGHGNLVDAGAFVNGTLTGITLLRYSNNGR